MPDSLNRGPSSHRETVPDPSPTFPQTAPEHLEALAFLFGLEAPPPSGARVLELGCAAGGNLIPFAARHPQASALGIDLSSTKVGQGRVAIGHAKLSNVELRACNLADIDASLGKFDYIICHGVYSRVAAPVQEAILRICSDNLADSGVAYVGYNVYPGWKALEVVRDAMILRGAPSDEPHKRLAYARGMLAFLEHSAPPDSALRKTLEETLPIIRESGGNYVLNEFLETHNTPCYFKEFVARAGGQGLSYLADAEPSTMFVQNYGEKVRESLLRECGGSQVMMEQYLDFIVNRTFRQSVLVKHALAPHIRYRLDARRLHALEYAGVFQAVDGGALTLDAREQPCSAVRDLQVTLRLPAHKALAQVLDEKYPASLGVPALVEAVSSRIGEPRDAIEPFLLTMLEELLIQGAVRVRRHVVPAAALISSQPQALAAVRGAPGLALSAGPAAFACNQWHEPVELSMLERCLLPLLDGSHSHDALADHLAAEARADRLRFIKDDHRITDDQALRDFTHQQVELALRDLRRKALLTA